MNTDTNLRHLLSKLDDYQLPPEYAEESADASASTTEQEITEALLSEYHKARDEYLRRKLERSVVEHVTTVDFDATRGTFEEPYVPDAEAQQALAERQAQVVQGITDKADAVQCKIFELQAKYKRFQERRAELDELVMLQNASNEEDGYDSDDNMGDDDDGDYNNLERQEQELDRKKAALQVQLLAVQQQTAAATKQLQQTNTAWAAMVEKENAQPPNERLGLVFLLQNPEALQRLEVANAEKEAEVANLKQEASTNIDLRLLLEKVSGMRIVSVTKKADPLPPPTTTTTAAAASGTTPVVNSSDALLMVVELHQKYVVEITLALAVPMRSREFTVAAAKFVSDNTLVTGLPIHMETGEDSATENTAAPPPRRVVQLRIPPLDDLVRLVATLPSGENLRVFLSEARSRIRSVQERVTDLTALLQEQCRRSNDLVVQIGAWGTTTTMGSEPGAGSIPTYMDQQVICSWDSLQLTAVFNLSPDFPVLKGSLSIDQLIGLGGWDTAVIHRIQESVQERCLHEHTSLVAVVHDIQAEVQRLQDEEGLRLPRTPTLLPMRTRPW